MISFKMIRRRNMIKSLPSKFFNFRKLDLDFKLTEPDLIDGYRGFFYQDKFVDFVSSSASMHNKYKGACAIIATGPSVSDISNEDFKNFAQEMDIFGVNGAISSLAEAGIDPVHYLVTDGGFIKRRPNMIETALNKTNNFFVIQKL